MISLAFIIFAFFNFVLPGIVYSFIFFYLLKGYWRIACLLLLSMVITYLLGIVIKSFFYFPRPYLITQLNPLFSWPLDGSFPSNHTGSTFAVSAGILRQNRRLGFNLIVISGLVAATRVAYSFHSWVDVAGGIFLAIMVDHVVFRKLSY